MKISKIFHFLYFSVLSIPLISMPIFAIYSLNHEITGYDLTIRESGYEGIYQTNEVETSADIVYDNVYFLDIYSDEFNGNEVFEFSFTLMAGEIYFDVEDIGDITTDDGLAYGNTTYQISYDAGYNLSLYSITFQSYQGVDFYINGVVTKVDITDEYQINLGNYFSETDWNMYHYVDDVLVTYDDTDIMSQFIYNEYNFMDKYLGIYKFSPFNNIYSWLNNTFFDGVAPLVFTIFYQWFAYWLFVSLCWLIFDVLMYVPLVAHRWLDKAEL